MKSPSPWHVKSGICPCWQCDGVGREMANPNLRVGDPSNHEIDCDVCEGAGHTPCEVCGFDIAIPGYDCLACQMVYDIPDELMTHETALVLATAVRAAVKAASQALARVAS